MDEQRIADLESRVTELERRLQAQPDMWTDSGIRDFRSAPPPRVTSHRVPAGAVAAAAVGETQPRGAAPPPHTAKPGISVGTSEAVLKWAGIGLVVLAVVFTLGLAIERGWITPVLRVVASGTVAVALFVAGQRIRRSRLVFAETLQGAAFVIAYLTALSMLVMDLVSGNVGFAAMVAVTVAALATASLLDSPPIAVLGILGGLATPPLLSSGIDDPIFLAFYVPLLAAAGWMVYSWTGWRSLANATALASWILLWVLVIDTQDPPVGLAIVVVGLLAWVVPVGRAVVVARGELDDRPTHFMEQALEPLLKGTTDRLTYAAPIVTFALAPFAFDLSRYQWSPIVAGTGVLFGLVALALSTGGFKDRAYVHITMAALLGAVGLTMAFNGDVLVVAVALQAVALTLIADRLEHRAMTWQANIMFGIALLAVVGRGLDRGFDGRATTAAWLSELAVLGLVVWKAAAERELRSLFGVAVHLVALGWLFTVLGDPEVILAVVALYAAARMATHFDIADFEFSNPVNGLTILLMTASAAGGQYFGELDYSAGRVAALASGAVVLAALFYRLPSRLREAEGALAYLTLLAWIAALAGSSDAWITGGWVLVGLAALAAGVRLAHSNLQMAGWATLAAATAKLLIVDLEATDPLVRIGLFFGIGVSFLGLAYLLPTRLAPAVSDEDVVDNLIPSRLS